MLETLACFTITLPLATSSLLAFMESFTASLTNVTVISTASLSLHTTLPNSNKNDEYLLNLVDTRLFVQRHFTL